MTIVRGDATFEEVARNTFTNPGFRALNGTTVVHSNLWRTPAMSNLSVVIAQGATLAVVPGGVEVTRTASPGRASTNAGQRVAITPGTYTVTARRQVDAPVGNSGSVDGRFVIVGYDSAGSHRSNAYRLVLGTAPTVGVETISETITPLEWVTTLELSWYSGGTNGDKIIWGDVGVITDAGPYFDGGYSPDPDLTPAWSGAVDGSASTLTAARLDGVVDARGIQSAQWGSTPSLRVLGEQLAETFGEKLQPFGATLHGGTLTVTDEAGLPAWASSSPVGALWNSGMIGWPAGTPEEVLPGGALVYGCALRTTGGANPQSLYGSFTVNADSFAFMVTGWDLTPGVHAPADVTVLVDRKPLTLDPVLTAQSGYSFIVASGLGPGTHQIDFIIGLGANLMQVIAPTGSTIAPGAVPSFRLGLMGDSYADSGIAPYYAGLARELWLLTGWTIYQLGQGSTGYTNDGASSGDTSKSVYGSPSRLAALTAGNLDALLVLGSVNDGSTAPATVAAAVTDYLAAIGHLPVVLAGVEPLHLHGVDTTAWDAVNTAVLGAAAAAPNVRAVIDWRGEAWLTGTGSVSVPRGDGNQDTYIGDAAGYDTIHPNYAGQKYLAGKFVAAMSPVATSAPSEWMPLATLADQTILVRARSAAQVLRLAGVEHRPAGGIIRATGTGLVELSTGLWKDAGTYAGTYTGEHIDGAAPDTPVARYAFVGVPDQSPSILTTPAAGDRLDPLLVVAPWEETTEPGTVTHRLMHDSAHRFTYRPPAPTTGVFELLFGSYAAARAARSWLSAPATFTIYEPVDDDHLTQAFMVTGDDLEIEQSDEAPGAWMLRAGWTEYTP